MKIRTQFLPALALLTLGLLAAPASRTSAAEPPPQTGKAPDAFEGEAPDPAFWSHLATARKASELIGLPVTDRPGHTLGKIADLLVDLTGGRLICALVLPPGDEATAGYIPVPAIGMYVQARNVTLVADKAVLEDVPRLLPTVTDPAALGKAAVHSFAYFNLKFVRKDREDMVELWKFSRLMTRKVKNPAGQILGTLANLMVDMRSGHVYFAIATLDGTEKNVYAVPPTALLVDRQEPAVLLEADQAKIAETSNRSGFFWTDIVDPEWGATTYKLYGKTVAGSGSAEAVAVGNSPGQLADTEIAKNIMSAWAGSGVAASAYKNVMVMASGGVITLQGRVKNETLKAKLSAVAEVVVGPGKVVDLLQVSR